MYQLHKEALINAKKNLEEDIGKGNFDEEPKWLKEHKLSYLSGIIEEGNKDTYRFNWQYHFMNWNKSYLAKATGRLIEELQNKVSNLEKELQEAKEDSAKQIEELKRQLAEEREIHAEAMKTMDNWYREQLIDDIIKKIQEKDETTTRTQIPPK
jgi:hypothetical protein